MTRLDWKGIEDLNAELASLDSAGMALPEGLAFAARQARKSGTREALAEAARAVESGLQLSDALARVRGLVPDLVVSLIRAGERGGNMLSALRQMGSFLEMRRRVVWAMQAAAVYPVLVLTFALGISWFLTFNLLPDFMTRVQAVSPLLPGKGDQFPRLISIAFLVQRGGVAVFALLWLAVLGILVASIVAPRSRGYQEMLLRLPLYGNLLRKYLLYNLSGVLGLLLREGVPLPDALDNLEALRESPLLSNAASSGRRAIERGQPLSEGLKAAAWIPRSELWLMGNAEKQELLDQYMNDLAARSTESIGRSEQLFRNLEPTLIAGLAIVVGGYVVSVFIPMARVFSIVHLGE
jgi:type IV pilus assembly protein PilC